MGEGGKDHDIQIPRAENYILEDMLDAAWTSVLDITFLA